MRALLVLLSVSVLVACGTTPRKCDATTCGGCCTSAGECVSVVTSQQCGSGGSQCFSCQPQQQCSLGICVNNGGGGGGTTGGGGGSTTGGGGGSTTGGGGGSTTGGGGGSTTGGGGGSTIGGGGGSTGGGGGALPMRLFITSLTYAGNLTGLAGADAACTLAAQAGGKGGTWKAWLSTSSVTAVSRMADVGPWVQQDAQGQQYPTFNNRANLSTTPNTQFFVNEQGTQSNASLYYWTGTDVGGMTALSSCTNWSSSASTAVGTYGSAAGGGTAWTNAGETTCDQPLSLLCLEQSHQPAPPTPGTAKRIFVTSLSFNGNLGGLTGADAKCATAAAAGNLTGTFKAWLSTSTTDAKSRFTVEGPWDQVWNSGRELTFRNLANLQTTPITSLFVNEQGASLTTSLYAWTGTSVGGFRSGSDCNGWTSSSASGVGGYGDGQSLSVTWTASGLTDCSQQAPLICIQQ